MSKVSEQELGTSARPERGSGVSYGGPSGAVTENCRN